MGDHKEFLKRITKTLYYGELPTLPSLSLPVTGMISPTITEIKRKTLLYASFIIHHSFIRIIDTRMKAYLQ